MNIIRIPALIAAAAGLNSCVAMSSTGYQKEKTHQKPSARGDQGGLTFELHFKSSDFTLHVPAVLVAAFDSQQDSVILWATSSRSETRPLHLTRFEMVTEAGTVRDLLGGQPQIIEFPSKPPYTASFESQKRPFRIRDGRKVTVNFEGRLGREAIRFSKSFKGYRDNEVGGLWKYY